MPVEGTDENKGGMHGGEGFAFSPPTLLLTCVLDLHLQLAWGWGLQAADSTEAGDRRASGCHSGAGRRWWL